MHYSVCHNATTISYTVGQAQSVLWLILEYLQFKEFAIYSAQILKQTSYDHHKNIEIPTNPNTRPPSSRKTQTNPLLLEAGRVYTRISITQQFYR